MAYGLTENLLQVTLCFCIFQTLVSWDSHFFYFDFLLFSKTLNVIVPYTGKHLHTDTYTCTYTHQDADMYTTEDKGRTEGQRGKRDRDRDRASFDQTVSWISMDPNTLVCWPQERLLIYMKFWKCNESVDWYVLHEMFYLATTVN